MILFLFSRHIVSFLWLLEVSPKDRVSISSFDSMLLFKNQPAGGQLQKVISSRSYCKRKHKWFAIFKEAVGEVMPISHTISVDPHGGSGDICCYGEVWQPQVLEVEG